MDPVNTPPTIPDIIGQVMPVVQSTLFGLGPVLLIVALVFAGYTRLTAADNAKKVQQANFTIMWAVVGYAVVLLSFFIIRLVASILGYDVGTEVGITL